MKTNISASELRRAADIKERIEELQGVLHSIFGVTDQPEPTEAELAHVPTRWKKRTMSPEARAKIGAALKKRWRKARAAGKLHL
jgi:hypothetical protein